MNKIKKIQNILITGGAGYIGSHITKMCINKGYNVVVLDNLINGHKDSIDKKAKFIQGDIEDSILISKIIKENKIEAIFHFASFIEAGESVKNPLKFYYNNTSKTIKFLNTLIKNNVNYFIFSSTAAIFGKAKYLPIDENHPKNPINPYGQSKLMVEKILNEIKKTNKKFKYGCLRYFNVAGADYKNNLRERHDPETHLIPLLLKFANKKINNFYIFGNDYNTKDGTCIRDYIHVLDICDAHLKLLEYLEKDGEEREFNLGTGVGYSVLEIVKKMEKILNKKLNIQYKKRREGDTANLIANGNKAKKLLNWKSNNSGLKQIIESVLK